MMATWREIEEAVAQIAAECRAVDQAVRAALEQVYGVRAGARQARMLRVYGAGWVPTYAEPVCLAPTLPEYETRRPAHRHVGADVFPCEVDEFYVRRVQCAAGTERWILCSRFDRHLS
jgi:hypothetical protein